MQKTKIVLLCILLLFLVMLTFLPRLSSLSLHWASDETEWMKRSRTFFFALQNGQFEDTYTAYHPGVTTTWLGSLALLNLHLNDPSFKNWVRSDNYLSRTMLARIRFPIAFVISVLILIASFCVYRLFGGTLAVLSCAFLAVEPFLLFESRRVHTDVLTALFLFVSLLLWLCYLEGELSCRRDLIFSGMSFGLACLTKSHAIAFLFFLPILLGWYIIQRKLSWERLLWGILLWFMVTLLTVQAVWPYIWTFPFFPMLCIICTVLLLWSCRNVSTQSYKRPTRTGLALLFGLLLAVIVLFLFAGTTVFARMYWALTETHNTPKLFLGNLRFDPGPLYFLVEFCIFSGLLTLLFIGFGMYMVWRQRLTADRMFRVTVVLLLFVLFYFFGLSFAAKKISRYLIIFLPAVSLMTALGAMHSGQLFNERIKKVLSKDSKESIRWFGYFFLVALFVLQAVPVLKLHPYYQTYHHPLIPGKWVEENSGSITGVGIDVAAAYLNAKPNAEKLRVRTTWFSRDLKKYFVGNTILQNTGDKTQTDNINYDIEYLRDKQTEGIPVDGPVNYRRSAYLQPGVKLNRELEHIVHLNGINYVWIYRVIKPEPTGNTDISPK